MVCLEKRIPRRANNPLDRVGEYMPLYEYKCPECGHEEEAIQNFGADNIKCKECLKKDKKDVEMKRKVSRTSFVLKGGAWAKDNYGIKWDTSNKPYETD